MAEKAPLDDRPAPERYEGIGGDLLLRVLRIISQDKDLGGLPPLYLEMYDLSALHGKGLVLLTNDPADALGFVDFEEATSVCHQVCRAFPERDGLPNVPLSDFEWEAIKREDAIEEAEQKYEELPA